MSIDWLYESAYSPYVVAAYGFSFFMLGVLFMYIYRQFNRIDMDENESKA